MDTNQQTGGETVHVGNLEGPIKHLCWKESGGLVRCDRMRGHGGQHSWERPRSEAVLAELVMRLRREFGIQPAPDKQAAMDAILVELQSLTSSIDERETNA